MQAVANRPGQRSVWIASKTSSSVMEIMMQADACRVDAGSYFELSWYRSFYLHEGESRDEGSVGVLDA